MSNAFDFIILENVDSTNSYLKEKIRAGEIITDTAVLALSQNSGKGRLLRKWYSEKGKSLTLSIALKGPLSPASTLLCALAVHDALSSISGDKNLQIKWPNDLVHKSKKLCGILTERVSDFTVFGIGINVNNDVFPEEIAHKATSLFMLTERFFDIEALSRKIAQSVKNTLIKYDFTLTEGGRNKYKNLCVNLGREVQFGNPLKKGIAEDISPEGELIVHICSGYEKVSFGDVFVSGIY